MDAVAIICDGLGAGPVENYRSGITEVLTGVFNGEAACRLDAEEEEDGGGYQEDLEGECRHTGSTAVRLLIGVALIFFSFSPPVGFFSTFLR